MADSAVVGMAVTVVGSGGLAVTLVGPQAGNLIFTGPISVVGSSATEFVVAKAGTDYIFQVDTATGSAVAGIKLTGATSAGTVALAVISTGSNANLSIDAKGSGTIAIGATSTGAITLGRATTITTGGLTVTGTVLLTTNSVTITGATPNLQLTSSTTEVQITLTPTSKAWTIQADASSGFLEFDNVSVGGGINFGHDTGSVFIGNTTTRSVTQPTNALNLFNGTAPSGTLANGVTLYSASGELTVMDAAGNATPLSPHHDRESGEPGDEWTFHSENSVTGRVLHIRMEAFVKAVCDRLGMDFVEDFIDAR